MKQAVAQQLNKMAYIRSSDFLWEKLQPCHHSRPLHRPSQCCLNMLARNVLTHMMMTLQIQSQSPLLTLPYPFIYLIFFLYKKKAPPFA